MSKWNLGWLGLAPKKWNKAASDFFTGTPEKRENVSTHRPEQEGLYQNAVDAGQEDFNAFAAPGLRQYNEEIVPGISEQFAGMGSGGLSSSGFRNAQVQGATDLSERLGALRAQLRQSSAQGLQNIGEVGLRNYSENMVTEPGTEGMLAPVAGAATTAVLGPAAGAAAYGAGKTATNFFNNKNSFGGEKVGNKSGVYGANGPQASPQLGHR